MRKILLLFPIISLLLVASLFGQESSPILKVPPVDSKIVPINVTFRWQDLTGVLSYTFEIAQDPQFLTQIIPAITLTDTSLTLPDGTLAPNTTYYWRVRGNYPDGPGPYSETFGFTTAGTPQDNINQMKGVVEGLVANSIIAPNQGNILDNRLDQALQQLGLGNSFVAIVQLMIFEFRITLLQNSNQLQQDNANSLLDYASATIQSILGGNSKFNIADYEQYITPRFFSLGQNYPNPFNPSTDIEYTVPEDGKVVLKVYDILGKEIVTLVNQNQVAGSYLVKWNASGFSSGIYLYRITAGTHSATKRMVLSK